MLFLKQITQLYEVRKCQISGEFIKYGQFYYEDDEDDAIVKFEVYKRMQQEAKDDQFDYSLLEQAKSDSEYKEMMKRAEKAFLHTTILDRKIAEKGQVLDTGLGNKEIGEYI